MARPSKPMKLLLENGRSNLTKKEIQERIKRENELKTGQKMKEKPDIRANLVAHKEFLRIKRLLDDIQMDDAMYENLINRYCMVFAECNELENLIKEINKKESVSEYLALSRLLQNKREMLLKLERESFLTGASGIKKGNAKVEKENPKEQKKALEMFGF